MNDLKIFENREFGDIRVLEIDNEPWFVGKDVAMVLGYANSRKALTDHVDDEDRTDGVTIRDSMGREQNPIFINESGLYSLILSSKLPNAKRFKRWITSEVLPSIRKHGAYATDEVIDNVLSDPDFGIKLLTELKNEREKNANLEEDNERMKPKEIFADAVATSKTSILVGELAKILKQNGYDTGEKRLFAQLRREGYLISRNGSDYNMPTQKSLEAGLMEIKETAVTHSDGHVTVNKTPKITGRGQQYFINRYLARKEIAVV